jgi:DNA-binding MarR family transcriptional regulator
MKRIYTSNDPTILRIHPTLANQIGLNESIMLLQLEFLISISKSEKREGRDWTFQSVRDLQEKYFPFWSYTTVNRVIKSLEEKGFITIDNFNKHKYDKTRWITINYENLDALDSIIVKDDPVSKRNTLCQNETGVCQNDTPLCQNDTRSNQNDTTIPEIPTEINTETPTELKIKGEPDLFDQCRQIYETKKGRLVTDGRGFALMIEQFKAAGVSAEDYEAAIDAMDADDRYTGHKPTSYQKWALNYARARKENTTGTGKGSQPKDPDQIIKEMIENGEL